MKIRTSKPRNNPYYMTVDTGGYNQCLRGYPTDPTANVLSNCVGYVNGRFAEIQGLDKIQYQFIWDAENLIEHAKDYGLKVQSRPVKGGIMVWKCGSIYSGADGHGHVAICERDESEMGKGVVFTSESAYGGAAFYNETRSNANGRWGMTAKYQYRGCIVNPAFDGDGKDKLRYKFLEEMPLRRFARSSSEQIGTVGKGEVHTAHKIKDKKDSTWIKIKDGGKWGWVCAQYKNKVYCQPK